MNIKKFIFHILPVISYCSFIGNPAAPGLQTTGLFLERTNWFSFRASYFQDFVYNQKFHEELLNDELKESLTLIQIWTQASQLTLNYKDRLDLYGIFGGQKLEIKEDVFSQQKFLWGVGGKFLIFNGKSIKAGCDIKYLESDPKPSFFQNKHYAYNIASDFQYNYSEIQAALGLSYKIKNVSPYANASYIISKIKAMPPSVTVKYPSGRMEVDITANSTIGRNRFGMVLGASITDKKKASLNFEWRAFNQNAINISGDLRF